MSSGFEPRSKRAIGRCLIWSSFQQVSADALAWFDPASPGLSAHAVSGGGRGSAWFVNVQSQAAVLRHYQRGGWMARFNRDLYLWCSERSARSFHEYAVMAQLAAAGLPVPSPIAALACRVSGVLYRAALITQRLPVTGTLADHTEPSVWHSAGIAIAQMHRLGVFHADLNVHNILVQAPDRVWLIDFDKARVGVTKRSELERNLDRLLRSVRKTCPLQEARLWPVLVGGYRSAVRASCPRSRG